MNFKAELNRRIKQIDQGFTNPITIEIKKDNGDISGNFAIYRRTNRAYNKPVFLSLPKDEAYRRCALLNQKELIRRNRERSYVFERGLEYRPDEVFYYDVVECGTGQESAFYNSKVVVKE